MNLELTDEQAALRDTLRRYLSEKASVSGHVRTLLEDPTGSTDAVWRGLVELGTTSLLVPVRSGGDGMSMTDAGLVCEELGAALHPGPLMSSAVAAPRALARFGADGEQVCELLTGIADGSVVATVALPSRCGASFAPEPIDTHNGGDDGDVILSGVIGQVPDAAAADVLLAVGTSSELYAVPLRTPQLQIAEITAIDKTSKNFRVTVDGACGHVVAAADPAAAEALADDMIIARAADALGAARQILQMTVEYAKVRRQFGAPIGSFQAVAHMCADMHETVELARSGVQYALWAADFADHTQRHRAALRVKAFAGRLANVGDLAIQVFGGIGFTWEHDAQLYLKRLLSNSRFLGSPEHYLEEVGRQLIRRQA